MQDSDSLYGSFDAAPDSLRPVNAGVGDSSGQANRESPMVSQRFGKICRKSSRCEGLSGRRHGLLRLHSEVSNALCGSTRATRSQQNEGAAAARSFGCRLSWPCCGVSRVHPGNLSPGSLGRNSSAKWRFRRSCSEAVVLRKRRSAQAEKIMGGTHSGFDRVRIRPLRSLRQDASTAR